MPGDDVHLLLVSIRAPAWGATVDRSGWIKLHGFQFALSHGERRKLTIPTSGTVGFNSRSRMGSDRHAR